MSEVYTVTVSNQDTVEITGGRVGNFIIPSQSVGELHLGGSMMDIVLTNLGTEEEPNNQFVVTDGIDVQFPENIPYRLYVTSPDTIYMCTSHLNSGNPFTVDLKIFHNR